MRIVQSLLSGVLLLGPTAPARALDDFQSDPRAPFIPAYVTVDSKVEISISTEDGVKTVLPLALAPTKAVKEQAKPIIRYTSRDTSYVWTFFPFGDESRTIVFSTKAVQLWSAATSD